MASDASDLTPISTDQGTATPISVVSGRATLAGYEWGDSGRSAVLLHPGVGDSRIWHRCAPAWAAAGWRLTAYDRRGFGRTTSEPEPHDELADLAAVVDARDARPAVMIGNSRGGAIAVDVAIEHPDRVAGMVLIAPSVSGDDESDWPTSAGEDRLDRLIQAAEAAGDLDAVNRLETHYWLDGADQPEGRVTGAPRELFSEMNRRALHAPSPGPALDRPPAWPRLGSIGCPVLVVAGEHDLPGIVDQCRRLADELPASRFELLPGTAHCPTLDAPVAIGDLVLRFLRELRAG